MNRTVAAIQSSCPMCSIYSWYLTTLYTGSTKTHPVVALTLHSPIIFLSGTVLFQPASLYSVLLLYMRYKLIAVTFLHSCGSSTTLERQIVDQHTTSVTPVPFIKVWLRYDCHRLSTCFLKMKSWQCRGWIIFSRYVASSSVSPTAFMSVAGDIISSS